MSVTPALGRLKQEDPGFKASLSYIERPYLKNSKTNKTNHTRREYMRDAFYNKANDRVLPRG
jgi:hypothetical protein